jgi:tRNA A58 N-methylase Trm61
LAQLVSPEGHALTLSPTLEALENVIKNLSHDNWKN